MWKVIRKKNRISENVFHLPSLDSRLWVVSRKFTAHANYGIFANVKEHHFLKTRNSKILFYKWERKEKKQIYSEKKYCRSFSKIRTLLKFFFEAKQKYIKKLAYLKSTWGNKFWKRKWKRLSFSLKLIFCCIFAFSIFSYLIFQCYFPFPHFLSFHLFNFPYYFSFCWLNDHN